MWQTYSLQKETAATGDLKNAALEQFLNSTDVEVANL